jgi:outer membrane protein TolC
LRKLLILAAAMASAPLWAQSLASNAAVTMPGLDYTSAFGTMALQAKTPAQPESAASLSPQQALQYALQKQAGLFIQPQTPAQEQAEILAAVHQLSYRINRAWTQAVATQQALGTLREVHDAAQTAAELAQRMAQVGNWSKVPMLQAQLVAANTATQVAQAQQQAFSAREKLATLAGLDGAQAHFKLPSQLPKLPEAPSPWADAENQALRNKLELETAKLNARIAQAKVSAQDRRDVQNILNSATAALGARPMSPLDTSALSAPVWPANLMRPHPALMKALTEQAHADTLSASTRSQAREAWFRYRNAWDIARHQRDVVLPLSTALQEETQLRYNGMLQSTWELLASARARLESVNAAQQALSDFWLAHTDLQAVVAGIDVTFSASSGPGNSGSNPAQGH